LSTSILVGKVDLPSMPGQFVERSRHAQQNVVLGCSKNRKMERLVLALYALLLDRRLLVSSSMAVISRMLSAVLRAGQPDRLPFEHAPDLQTSAISWPDGTPDP
jgi:hypothetical protein